MNWKTLRFFDKIRILWFHCSSFYKSLNLSFLVVPEAVMKIMNESYWLHLVLLIYLKMQRFLHLKIKAQFFFFFILSFIECCPSPLSPLRVVRDIVTLYWLRRGLRNILAQLSNYIEVLLILKHTISAIYISSTFFNKIKYKQVRITRGVFYYYRYQRFFIDLWKKKK